MEMVKSTAFFVSTRSLRRQDAVAAKRTARAGDPRRGG